MQSNIGGILEQSHNKIAGYLKSRLGQLFENTDDYLFEKARGAANNADQDVYFEAMRNLRKAQERISKLTVSLHHDHFLKFSKNPEALLLKKEKHSLSGDINSGLSLVDESMLEINLAITDMANRAEGICSEQLFGLNERMSVLSGGAKVTEENNPVAPKAIADSFAEALAETKLDLKIHLMILKLFDQYCLRQIKETYIEINNELKERGILPNLKYSTTKNTNNPIPAPQNQEQDQSQEHQDNMSNDYNPEIPQQHAGNTNQQPWQQTQASQEDLELFQTIRELLSGRRTQQTGYQANQLSGQAQPVQSAPVNDVVSVLSALQSESLHTPAGQAPKTRGIAQIKSALSHKLSDLNGGNKNIQMGSMEEDTADLMGMMFDHIFQEKQTSNVLQNQISKLQIPMLKVALQDKQFFTKRNHPARELLNLINELGTRWLVEGENDRAVLPPIHTAIDKILHEYDTDAEVFDDISEDLKKHRDKLKKRASRNEKRAMDAIKGREKLALSHQQAEQEIECILKDKNTPAYAKTLLKEGWSSYVALSILRHGKEDKATTAALQTAQDIVNTVTPRQDESDRKYWRGQLPSMRTSIEDGLTLVGYHHDDIHKILSELSYCQGWALSAPTGSKLPVKLNEKKPLIKDLSGKAKTPEFGSSAKKLRGDKQALEEATKAEQDTMTQIKSLPFGTWFDYASPENNNAKERVKLSWYSPVSSKCLFVDRRGQLFAEKSLLETSRDLLNNRASIVKQDKQPLIDRALKAIAELLGKAMPVAAT